jgi:hypothetical protein
VSTGAALLAQRGGFGGGSRFRGVMANLPYDGQFTFVRMSYPVGFGGGRQGPPWSHDYPVGEAHFMSILTGVSNVRGHRDGSNVLAFDDPEMFKYPVIYLVEPGYWDLGDAEAAALRDYLMKGGFLIVDDFPSWAWPNFEAQMSRVLPRGQWRDLAVDHPIWHSFFEIASLDLPPPYPELGPQALYRALFEENDPAKRMYVVANYQTDISEYWEFSETGAYIVDQSNEAYKFGVNEFIYGITH